MTYHSWTRLKMSLSQSLSKPNHHFLSDSAVPLSVNKALDNPRRSWMFIQCSDLSTKPDSATSLWHPFTINKPLRKPRRQWMFTVYSDITDIMYTTFYTQLRAVTCSAQWNCYLSLHSRCFGMFSFLSRHVWLKYFVLTLYKVSCLEMFSFMFVGTHFFLFPLYFYCIEMYC